jgi:drug/metabolite transporter (DMT)-like permease
LTALFLAGNNVMQRYIAREDELDKMIIVSVSMITGGVLMFAYILIAEGMIIFPNPIQFIMLLFLGFGTLAIPMILLIDAYKFIGVSKVSLVSYLAPVFSGIIAFFLNNERDFSYKYLITGSALIILGLICTERSITKISD